MANPANQLDVAESLPVFQLVGIHMFAGSGAPTFSAKAGSLYVNLAGSGTTDRIYINTTGSTTWTYLTAGA